MLAVCLIYISIVITIATGIFLSESRIHMLSGSSPKAASAQKEESRDTNAAIIHIIIVTSDVCGEKIVSTPILVATPFPPLNLRNRE